jgi:hypothetical protein
MRSKMAVYSAIIGSLGVVSTAAFAGTTGQFSAGSAVPGFPSGAIQVAQAEPSPEITTPKPPETTRGGDEREAGQVVTESRPVNDDGAIDGSNPEATTGDMVRDAKITSKPVERDLTGSDKVIEPGDMKRTVEDAAAKK